VLYKPPRCLVEYKQDSIQYRLLVIYSEDQAW